MEQENNPTSQTAAPSSNTDDAVANTQPKKKGKALMIILIILGVLIVLIVGFFLIINLATGGAKKVSDEFIADIRQTQSEQAYGLFSSAAKKVVGKKKFAKTVEQISPILNGQPKVTGKEAGTSSDGGTTSSITYEINGTDGITYKVKVELVKEGNDWRVLNFDSSKKDK